MLSRAGRLAWAVWAVALAATVCGLVFLWLSRATPTQDPLSFRGEDTVIMIAFGTMGAVVASRRPSNPIGWLFLVVGVASGVSVLFQQYATYALLTREGDIPGGAVAAWAFNVVPIPGHGLGLAFVLLLFPDGRLPSRRWRAVGWLVTGAIGVVVVGLTRAPGPLRDFPEADNPFAVQGGAGALVTWIADAGFVVFVLAVALCLASVVVRFRSTGGVARAQLKWFLFSGSLVTLGFMVYVAVEVIGQERIPQGVNVLPLVALCAMPVSTGIAILKYRLYDVDRVISRTLAFTLLTGVLVGVYVVAVLVGSRALGSVGAGGDLAVAAATLAVAAVFRSARRRIQSGVDRRFNRARYDAEQVVAALRERLRHEVDLDDVVAATRDAVARSIAPARVSLWLRDVNQISVAPSRTPAGAATYEDEDRPLTSW